MNSIMWNHTITYWHATETGFDTYVFPNCSYQPVELMQHTPYGVESSRAIRSNVKVFIPKQEEPIPFTFGADFIAFGDFGFEPRPVSTAQF